MRHGPQRSREFLESRGPLVSRGTEQERRSVHLNPPAMSPVPCPSESGPSKTHAGGLSLPPTDCCLPGRCLWLPDFWGWCGAGRFAVLPLQRHPRCPRSRLHHPLCADVLPYPAFLRPVSTGRRQGLVWAGGAAQGNPPAPGLCLQGGLGGSLAPLHRGDGGGGRGSGAEEAPAPDHQLVPPNPPPGSLHP